MYGEAGTASAQVPPVRETVSSIDNETIKGLESCVRSADHLIGKVLGPRPEEATKELPLGASVMNDAKRLNILMHKLQARLEELHGCIGHDKQ